MSLKAAIASFFDKKIKLPFANIEIGLADNWRDLKTKATVIFGSIMVFLQMFGPQLRDWWMGMPDEIKAVLPTNAQTGIKYAILFASLVALRYTTARKIRPPENQ